MGTGQHHAYALQSKAGNAASWSPPPSLKVTLPVAAGQNGEDAAVFLRKPALTSCGSSWAVERETWTRVLSFFLLSNSVHSYSIARNVYIYLCENCNRLMAKTPSSLSSPGMKGNATHRRVSIIQAVWLNVSRWRRTKEAEWMNQAWTTSGWESCSGLRL